MNLNQTLNHPSTRSYVLKLHRDALPEIECIIGRLENMSSGRYYKFRSGAELLAILLIDLTRDANIAAGRNYSKEGA